MENYNFDNIRPYRDNEVYNALKQLFADKDFLVLLKKIFSEEEILEAKEKAEDIKSIEDFQSAYILPYASSIINHSINKLSYSGFENVPRDKTCLFISNHRDIILDPALLNEILVRNNIKTTEIGIGNNLLITPWIKSLVRLNKTFIVRRDVQGKEILQASKQLSAYIRNTVCERNTSIWIAQRQGRTKDGNDKTQAGLLKMFNFSGKLNFTENFKELNIIPVSISYEYEPCDDTKTAEMCIIRQGGKYEKTSNDDLRSMGRGLYNKKGRVHFCFNKIVSEELKSLETIRNKNQKFETLTGIIDKKIYKGYKLWEFNYIAYDILYKTKEFTSKYSPEKKQGFINYLQKNTSEIVGNPEIINKLFLEIYAKPVKNKLKL